MGLVEATVRAAHQRLRPILMTSLAFVLGVLPLALAGGAGSGGQNANRHRCHRRHAGGDLPGHLLRSSLLCDDAAPFSRVTPRRKHEPPATPSREPVDDLEWNATAHHLPDLSEKI